MSLHLAYPRPPLALAIHPAPQLKPRESSQDKDKKNKADIQEKEQNVAEEGHREDKELKKEGTKDGKNGKVGKDVEPPPTPLSGNLNAPEPPTPAPGASPAIKSEKLREDKPAERLDKAGENDAVGEKDVKETDAQTEDSKDAVKIDEEKKLEESKEDETEPKPEPLILLAPAPHMPLRARIDLPPSVVYPPINTDTRGAYYKYARAANDERLYVNITKAGWLNEQWKERTEREALKRLTGAWERELEKEIQKERKRALKKKVPDTSEGILLDLWNELVQAGNHELCVNEFWNRYDWSTQEAQKYLSTDVKRPDDSRDSPSIPKPSVTWTRSGVEEVLSTVGVQCAYNLDRSPSRHWSEPSAAYLLLARGFFLLRLDRAFTWKTKEQINRGFEALVADADDRILGEIVKGKMAEDRKRREKQYIERKEKERKERKEKELKEGKQGEEPDEPNTPQSDVQVRNGEPVQRPPPSEEGPNDKKVIVVLPVDKPEDKDKGLAAQRDAKHDLDVKLVPGPRQPADAVADQNVKTPNEKDARPPAPVAKGFFEKATKALELAKDSTAHAVPNDPNTPKRSGRQESSAKRNHGPVFWTWTEKCEKWRWRNYEKGAHIIALGGWEERDWEVFADDREVKDWDNDQAEIEKQEIDVHDWSL